MKTIYTTAELERLEVDRLSSLKEAASRTYGDDHVSGYKGVVKLGLEHVPGSLGFHELFDRLSLAVDYINTKLLEHPASLTHVERYRKIHAAAQHLQDIYASMGHVAAGGKEEPEHPIVVDDANSTSEQEDEEADEEEKPAPLYGGWLNESDFPDTLELRIVKAVLYDALEGTNDFIDWMTMFNRGYAAENFYPVDVNRARKRAIWISDCLRKHMVKRYGWDGTSDFTEEQWLTAVRSVIICYSNDLAYKLFNRYRYDHVPKHEQEIMRLERARLVRSAKGAATRDWSQEEGSEEFDAAHPDDDAEDEDDLVMTDDVWDAAIAAVIAILISPVVARVYRGSPDWQSYMRKRVIDAAARNHPGAELLSVKEYDWLAAAETVAELLNAESADVDKLAAEMRNIAIRGD